MISTSLWVSALIVLVAVGFDLKTRSIPNTVTLGGLAAGLAIHVVTGIVSSGVMGGLRGLGVSLLGAFACSILPIIAWKRNEMGGGDVKLFAALGALLGAGVGFDIQAKTFVLAFVLLFPYRLLRHRVLGVAIKNAGIGLVNLVRAKSAQVKLLDAPKLPPVIMAPTIGIAFVLSVISTGGLEMLTR